MTKCGVHFLWLTVRLQMTIENMVCGGDWWVYFNSDVYFNFMAALVVLV